MMIVVDDIIMCGLLTPPATYIVSRQRWICVKPMQPKEQWQQDELHKVSPKGYPHHQRFNELQKSMFQQADSQTSLVAWDQRSAFCGGSDQVVRVLLRPTEVYHSYSHQSMIFVSAAQVAESLLQRNLSTVSQNIIYR